MPPKERTDALPGQNVLIIGRARIPPPNGRAARCKSLGSAKHAYLPSMTLDSPMKDKDELGEGNKHNAPGT